MQGVINLQEITDIFISNKKKGTLYPAVIGIAFLTLGAVDGFWSAGNGMFFIQIRLWF
jgi:hypothetical protein